MFFNASCLTKLLSHSEADVLLEAIDILDEREAEEGHQELAPYGFELAGSGPGSSLTSPINTPLPSPGSESSSSTFSDTPSASTSLTSSTFSGPVSRKWTAYAAMHRPNRILAPERLILELELINQSPDLNDVAPAKEGGDSFKTNTDKDDYEEDLAVTEEDLWESTVPNAAPLKEMVRLKRRREREILRRVQMAQLAKEGGEDRNNTLIEEKSLRQRDDQVARESHLHVVQLLGQVEDQLGRATDLTSFYKITAGVFKELSEFDRAMIYQVSHFSFIHI